MVNVCVCSVHSGVVSGLSTRHSPVQSMSMWPRGHAAWGCIIEQRVGRRMMCMPYVSLRTKMMRHTRRARTRARAPRVRAAAIFKELSLEKSRFLSLFLGTVLTDCLLERHH